MRVVVIGGGVIGLLAAHYLRQRGAEGEEMQDVPELGPRVAAARGAARAQF